MNVLVITDVLWRDDNGVGNSYSNIFNGIESASFANICCQCGRSENNVSKVCFQISETTLVKNLNNRQISSGNVEKKDTATSNTVSKENRFLVKIKKSRLQIFFWLRNFIWKIGKWKSKELREFIDDFKPDIIFAQVQDKMYLNNLVRYVKDYTNKPLFLYAWDDVYSLKQFSFSPLFWIDRFFQRRSIRKLVKKCEILYTISEEQKLEYAKTLKAHTELLYKGYDFNDDTLKVDKQVNSPIKILYTGNLYSGRYKTLKKFCKELNFINQSGQVANLEIYSATPLSKKQKEKLNYINSSCFLGKVSEKEVQDLQQKADVLLHIEPFSLKGSLLCRLSFSTKLVDYFYNRKCVFALGHKRCSSIKYLKRYDAAIVVDKLNDVKSILKDLLSDTEVLQTYKQKAYKCGYNNHQITNIQENLLKEFNKHVL